MFRLLLGVAAVTAVFSALNPVHAQDLKLTSLDWPPFTGPQLQGGGASLAVARAAFGSEGRALQVEFFPWQRAVDTGLKEPGFVGYFPEYRSKELEETCAFSSSIGTSPLGFAEAKAKPVAWTSLDDLKGKAIGVVKGYVNTEAFDARMNSGALKTEAAVNDVTNLRKVAGGRLDLAVVDLNVMRYLLASQPSLADVRDKIAFNTRPLEDKTLHVCFRKSADGAAALKLFESGLKRVNVDAINADALARIVSAATGS